MKTNSKGLGTIILFIAVCFSGCERPFNFSPYDGRVPDEFRHTTQRNLTEILRRDTAQQQAFKIALLSDTHYHYDDLHDAVQHINTKNDIAFVVVTGDIAESGLLGDFIFFHKTMQKLRIPYLTVIGNHDYLANGEKIYQQMFGDLNYSFIFNNTKFIMFDNVFWESDKAPDFPWLEHELGNNEISEKESGYIKPYRHIIPFSHIPPFDQQFRDHASLYHQLLVKNGVFLSVHGHRHSYFLDELFGDGIRYLTIPSPQKRSYCELIINEYHVEVQKVDY